MIRIQDTLKYDIDRNINGVVKATDVQENTVITELREYVVTTEITKHMTRFFDRYADSLVNDTENIGVWISGFFGSGKSHFLKMLGYIIENKEFHGKKASDLFKEKIKDPILFKNLEMSSKKPTDIILFNVDNTSNQSMYSKKDTIVMAFLKNFNKYLGFFTDELKVASFERSIWEKGLFEKFKDEFKSKTTKEWVNGRKDYIQYGDEIVEIVSQLGIMSKSNGERWLEHESEQSVSVESFCNLIRGYLETKGKDHRIVFLVDEIGQYIGNDSSLMLNLQTLVELLGVNFQGRVWVGVTSQQDLGSILNTNNKNKTDFSKIQDRFKTMLSLSSGNTDEVIKKRLLEKKDVDNDDLKSLYEKYRIDIENLINFNKKSATQKLYDDKIDFAETYPFVGYQFNLLQKVFENARNMGHSGQHMSNGERSLLGSFQEAVKRIKEKEIKTLVPFNYFYESIEQFLSSDARRPVIHAKTEKGVDDFGVEVLKLLFMLKGIKVDSDINTLTSFMIDSIECDRIELEEKIKKALKKLEKEVLIQKDGDFYFFLTNEEQDINKEIANEYIDPEEKYKNLDSFIGEIFDKNSIIEENTENKYKFSRKIDDNTPIRGRESLDLTIFTPSADNYDKVEMIGSRDGFDLIIKLPEDEYKEYIQEIEYSLKVDAYIKKMSGNTKTSINDILIGKQRQNQGRKTRIKLQIERAIENSKTYINGHEVKINAKSASGIIEESLKTSARNKFVNAGLIKRPYDESRIKDIIKNSDFSGANLLISIERSLDNNENKDAINEVLNRIKLQCSRVPTLTLKDLVDFFEKEPYGWNVFNINGLIGELWIYNRINIEESKTLIKDKNELSSLLVRTQSKTLERVVISIKEEIDPRLISKGNNLLKSIFGSSVEIQGNSPKEEIIDIISRKLALVKKDKIDCQRKKYPGEKALKRWIDILEDIVNSNKKADRFLKEFIDMKDELIEEYENASTVQEFLSENNPKRIKFDLGVKILEKIRSLDDYLGVLKDTDDYKRLREIREMESPYTYIREIDGLVSNLNQGEQKIIENEKNNLFNTINKKGEILANILKNNDSLLEELNITIDKLKNEIDKVKDTSIIITNERKVKNTFNIIEESYRDSIKNKISFIEGETINIIEKKDSVIDLIKRVRESFDHLKNSLKCKELKELNGVLKIAQSEKEEFLNEASGKMLKKERVSIKKVNGKIKYALTTEDEVEKYINDMEKEIYKLKDEMLKAIRENKVVDID